jgi:hypothetical protein
MFALGASSTLVCPAETFTVSSSASCEVAAAVAGRPYGGIAWLLEDTAREGHYYMPAGCVWWSAGGSFYFNTATPSGRPIARLFINSQPVCAGAPRFLYRRQRSGSECGRERACVFVSPPTAAHIQIVK